MVGRNQIHLKKHLGVESQNITNNKHKIKKIGQVSLPVLSRKGKFDNWNHNWISHKNYALNFNEDLFIKHFFYMFFAYSVSTNKHYLNMYATSMNKRVKHMDLSKYNIKNHRMDGMLDKININNPNKNYTSKVYVCKYNSWIFVYLFIYSITNIRVKIFKKNTKINYHNYTNIYQAYLLNKQKYNK